MGFLDFDKERFWDVREMTRFDILDSKDALMSDSRNRLDATVLLTGDITTAQANKEFLETQ